MDRNDISTEDRKLILKEELGRMKLAEKYGISNYRARTIINSVREKESIADYTMSEHCPGKDYEDEIQTGKDHEKKEYNMISHRSSRITTVDQLLEFCEVDLDVYEIVTFDVNKWEVGAKDADGNIVVEPLFQVKVKLKRNQKAFDIKQIRKDLIEDALNHCYEYPAFDYKDITQDPHLLEIAIPDLHLGKLAWAEETGENYDSKIAQSMFLWAVETLLRKARTSDIERILFPIGNDLLNVDNSKRETQRGTPQDEDSRYQKSFRMARKMIVKAIEMCTEVAPVDVVIIQGNHDFERMFYLGDSLEGWMHGNDNVRVLNSPKTRKYYLYGNTMIGFTHGDKEKVDGLPMLMAAEAKEFWSKAKFHEFHTGHLHKARSTSYYVKNLTLDEFNGVRVRIVPSLSGTDAWHYQKGFVENIRSAEAHLFHKEAGHAGYFNVNGLQFKKENGEKFDFGNQKNDSAMIDYATL